MHALILTNLTYEPNPITPEENLEKWKATLTGFDVQLLDAKGSTLQTSRLQSINRARLHMDLWQRIANLEFGDTWTYILEEDATPLTSEPGRDLHHAVLPESAGILMIGSTQEYVSVSDMICQSQVEPLSQRSSGLLEAPILAYAVTPEFAGRLYAHNYSDPVGISHVLVDMFEKTTRPHPLQQVQEPPRFFRVSCAAFSVSSKRHRFDRPDSSTRVNPDSEISRSAQPISLKALREKFELEEERLHLFTENTHSPTDDHSSPTPALRPIRMQATRPTMRPSRYEFESGLQHTTGDTQTGLGIRKFASLAIVLCCVLVIVCYMLVRYFRRPVEQAPIYYQLRTDALPSSKRASTALGLAAPDAPISPSGASGASAIDGDAVSGASVIDSASSGPSIVPLV